MWIDAGFRLYGDVVSDEVDAINYSQHLRELQNYITPPQSATSPSSNDQPLLNVMSLSHQAALHVRITCNLRSEIT